MQLIGANGCPTPISTYTIKPLGLWILVDTLFKKGYSRHDREVVPWNICNIIVWTRPTLWLCQATCQCRWTKFLQGPTLEKKLQAVNGCSGRESQFSPLIGFLRVYTILSVSPIHVHNKNKHRRYQKSVKEGGEIEDIEGGRKVWKWYEFQVFMWEILKHYCFSSPKRKEI